MFRLLLDSNTCILQPNAISGEIASSGFRFYIKGQNEQTLMMKGGEKRRKRNEHHQRWNESVLSQIYCRDNEKYRPRPNRFPNIANFRLPVNQVTRIHFDTVSKDLQAINRRSLWFCLMRPIQFPLRSIKNKIGFCCVYQILWAFFLDTSCGWIWCLFGLLVKIRFSLK